MAATIRLMRFGKKRFPAYRIVAIDKRKPRTSDYLDLIGVYQPVGSTPLLQMSKSKLEKWQAQGAELSEGVAKLLKGKKNITFTE